MRPGFHPHPDRDGLLLERVRPARWRLLLPVGLLLALALVSPRSGDRVMVLLGLLQLAAGAIASGMGATSRLSRVLVQPRRTLWLGRRAGESAYRDAPSSPAVELDRAPLANESLRGLAVRKTPRARVAPYRVYLVLERKIVAIESFETLGQAQELADRLAAASGLARLDDDGAPFELVPPSFGYAIAILLSALAQVGALGLAATHYLANPQHAAKDALLALCLFVLADAFSFAICRSVGRDAVLGEVRRAFGIAQATNTSLG